MLSHKLQNTIVILITKDFEILFVVKLSILRYLLQHFHSHFEAAFLFDKFNDTIHFIVCFFSTGNSTQFDRLILIWLVYLKVDWYCNPCTVKLHQSRLQSLNIKQHYELMKYTQINYIYTGC